MTKTANSASKAALIRRHHLPLYAYDYVNFSVWFHAVDSLRRGSGVERIVPLRFRAGCRKRRLNEALSVLSVSMFYFCVYCFY